MSVRKLLLKPHVPPDPLRLENTLENVPKAKDRFLYIVSSIIIAVAILVSVVLFYWTVLQPSQIYSVKDNRISIVPPVSTAGSTVEVKFSFCKLIDIDGIITRSFVGEGTEIPGVTKPENVGKACINDISSPIPIPPQISPGEYRIKYVASYHLNPIKNVEETFYSEPFKIVARDKAGEQKATDENR